MSSGVLPDLRRSPILQDATAWKSIVIDGVRKENGMASFAQWINSEDAEALRVAPRVPTKPLELGSERLLEMTMVEAADHFGADKSVIPQPRTRLAPS